MKERIISGVTYSQDGKVISIHRNRTVKLRHRVDKPTVVAKPTGDGQEMAGKNAMTWEGEVIHEK